MKTENKSIKERFLDLGKPEILRKNISRVNNTLCLGFDPETLLLVGGGVVVAAASAIVGRYELFRGQHVVMKTGGEVSHTVIRASRFPWKFFIRGLQTPIYVDESPRLIAMREDTQMLEDNVIAAGQPIEVQFMGGGTAELSLGIKASIKNGADFLGRFGANRKIVDIETEPELIQHITTVAVKAAQVAAGQFTLPDYLNNRSKVTEDIDSMIRDAVQLDLDNLIINSAPGTANQSSKRKLAETYATVQNAQSLFDEGAKLVKNPSRGEQKKGRWTQQQARMLMSTIHPREKQDMAIVIHDAVANIKLHDDLRESIDEIQGTQLSIDTWRSVVADPRLGIEALRILDTNRTALNAAQVNNNTKIVNLVGLGGAFQNGGLRSADALRVAGLGNEDEEIAAADLTGKGESARETHEKIKRRHLGNKG